MSCIRRADGPEWTWSGRTNSGIRPRPECCRRERRCRRSPRCCATAGWRRPRSTPRSTAPRCARWRCHGRELRNERPANPRQRLPAPATCARLALERDGRLLPDFIDHLYVWGAERITTDIALQWATLPAAAHPAWWRTRLRIVRGFARYL